MGRPSLKWQQRNCRRGPSARRFAVQRPSFRPPAARRSNLLDPPYTSPVRPHACWPAVCPSLSSLPCSSYLVAETASLVGTGRAGSTVADVQLPVLPAANAQQETEHVRLLALVQLSDVPVRGGGSAGANTNMTTMILPHSLVGSHGAVDGQTGQRQKTGGSAKVVSSRGLARREPAGRRLQYSKAQAGGSK